MLATAIVDGGDLVLDEWHPGRHRLPSTAGLTGLTWAPTEEPGHGVKLKPRDAGEPARIGVQRRLVEPKVSNRSRASCRSFPSSTSCSGMVPWRASSTRVSETKLRANRSAAEMRGSTTPADADGDHSP